MKMEEIIQDILAKGYKKVGIQTPDGLKDKGVEIAIKLNDLGLTPIIVTASAFGACDLADDKVMKLGAQCLIHLGHSQFYVEGRAIEGDIPVYYLEWEYDYPVASILESNIKKIKEQKLGLIGTAQHLHLFPEIISILKKHGKEAIIGEEGIRTRRKGQVLGCDSSTAAKIAHKVEAFLYIGSGYFHPIKILDEKKPLYKLDPIEGNLKLIDPELRQKELRAEYAKVLKYAEEKNWGILLSTKKGQFFPHIAEQIKKKLEPI
jgi:2-(3-amino-3-carboxypropyl)histidine synthase